MYKRCVAALALLFPICSLITTPNARAAEAYTEISSDNYTPSVPVFDFFGSWKGAESYNQADHAYANHKAEIGVRYETWSFGLFARLDYYLEMHPEVGEYRYLFHNARDQLQDKNYVYDFYEQRLATGGFRLGYQLPLPEEFEHIQVSGSLNLLHSTIFQNRDVRNGYINGKTRLGDGDVLYHFNEDTLFTLLDVENSPKGYGGSLDIAVNYKYDWRWSFGFEAKDLFHFVRFKESPFASGTLRYNEFYLDEDGVRDQTPLVDLYTHEAGNYDDFEMNLPERLKLYVNYRFKYKWAIQANALKIGDNHYYSLKTSYIPKRGHSYAISVEPTTKSIGVHYGIKNLELALTTDDLNINKANRLNAYIGYKWDW